MAITPIGLVLGSEVAERQGVTDPQARIRLALLGGLLGGDSPVTGVVLTTVLARREAEAVTVPPASPPVSPPVSLVMVPDVRNETFEAAKGILESVGLEVPPGDPPDVISITDRAGHVVSQDPVADALVSVGSQVTLTVSLGFPMPDVVEPERLSFEEAKQELEKFGLTMIPEGRPDDQIDKDLVISQDPEAGTLVSAGDEVKIIVSQGRAKLTDFVGRGFQDARDELQDLGLGVERIPAETSDDDKAPHEVVGQEPAAGSPVALGSEVKLTVNPVQVPKLEGQYFQEARETLQDLDLRVRRKETDNSASKGVVVAQDPESGLAEPGILVTLTVSKGGSPPGPSEK